MRCFGECRVFFPKGMERKVSCSSSRFCSSFGQANIQEFSNNNDEKDDDAPQWTASSCSFKVALQ